MGCLNAKLSERQSCDEHKCNKYGCFNVISGEGKSYCVKHHGGLSTRALQSNPKEHGLITVGEQPKPIKKKGFFSRFYL